MRLLLVEEDVRLSQTLVEVFQKKHYGLDAVYSGTDGLKYAKSAIYDVIILDTELPDADGLEVLINLRKQKNNVPVMLLSSQDDVKDKVRGLDSGADDYMTKPFSTDELLARIRALSRRKGCLKEDSVNFGDLIFSKSKCELQNKNGDAVKLSFKELQIMELFFENPRQVIKKEHFIEKIWGGDSDAEYNNVEVYISFIRKKLEQLNVSTVIRTARGIGYSLEFKAAN